MKLRMSSAAGQPGAADYPPVMSRHLLNLTTATRENALTDEEREAFLAEKRVEPRRRLVARDADLTHIVTWLSWRMLPRCRRLLPSVR
jgi:hypothetical protein